MNIAVIIARYVRLVAMDSLVDMNNEICIDIDKINFPKDKKTLSAIK